MSGGMRMNLREAPGLDNWPIHNDRRSTLPRPLLVQTHVFPILGQNELTISSTSERWLESNLGDKSNKIAGPLSP